MVRFPRMKYTCCGESVIGGGESVRVCNGVGDRGRGEVGGGCVRSKVCKERIQGWIKKGCKGVTVPRGDTYIIVQTAYLVPVFRLFWPHVEDRSILIDRDERPTQLCNKTKIDPGLIDLTRASVFNE